MIFFFVKENKKCILKYFIFNIESLKYKNYFHSEMLDLPDGIKYLLGVHFLHWHFICKASFG
jgi:hypothetical protein